MQLLPSASLVGLASMLLACEEPPPRTPSAAAAAPSACEATAESRSRSAFELVILGSGGPTANGRAASSYLLRLDGTPRILVDVGPGSFARMGEARIDLARVDTILLTHLHIDHAGELPGIVKSRDLSSDAPLTFRIFGPSGRRPYPSTTAFVEQLFGDKGVFAYLPTFRNALDMQVRDLPIAQDAPIQELFEEERLKVTSIAVDHGDIPAVAYRIDYAGHAVVVSGDLASKNDNLARLARDADVLVYDTSVLDPPASPIPLYDLHTSPRRIGEIATAAHVKHVVLGHVPPQVERAKHEVLHAVQSQFEGDITFADDCLVVDATH